MKVHHLCRNLVSCQKELNGKNLKSMGLLVESVMSDHQVVLALVGKIVGLTMWVTTECSMEKTRMQSGKDDYLLHSIAPILLSSLPFYISVKEYLICIYHSSTVFLDMKVLNQILISSFISATFSTTVTDIITPSYFEF